MASPSEEERLSLRCEWRRRAGSLWGWCGGRLEAKGSDALYSVGDSLMALYVTKINTWVIKVT